MAEPASEASSPTSPGARHWSREDFRTCVEALLDCFGIFTAERDQSGRIVDFRVAYLNEAACRSNRRTLEEQAGRSLLELLPAHLESGLFAAYVEVVEHGRPLDRVMQFYADTFAGRHEERWYDIRAVRLGDGFAAAWRDVTERHREGEKHRGQEALLQRLADANVVGIGVGNARGEALFANDEMLRMMGRSRAELDSGQVNWAEALTAESRAQAEADVAQLLRDGVHAGAEREFLRPDGTRTPFLASAAMLPGGDTHVSVAVDLTRIREAQSRLRDSEARFRALVEAAPSIAVFINADGRTGFANSRWQEYFGISFEEASRREWVGALHPDDRDRVAALWTDCVARGADFETECRAVRRDGEARWHLSRFVPVRDATGALLGWCGTITDVHGLKTSQDRLRESEERFRIMADGLPLIVWVHDAEGRQEFVNRTFCEYFGVDEAELDDGRWRLLAHPEDAASYAEAFMRAVRERTAFRGVVRARRGDGAWRWLESYGRPRWSPTGAFLGMVGTSVDITERLESEAALRQSEERFRTISEALPNLVFVSTPDGENTYVSRGYCEYVGRDAEGLLGRGYMDLMHPEDAPAALPMLRDAVARGEPLEAEFRIRRRDGAWRWHLVRTVPNRRADGTATEWIGTGTDITAHKETEAALYARTQELQALVVSAPLGIGYLDRELRYVQINEELARINGVSSADHIGRRLDEVLPELAAVVAPLLERVFTEGTSIGNIELAGETPGAPGVQRHWLCGFYPVRDAAGAVHTVGCWVTEITAMKRAEEALREADRRKDQFLATLAHELRNPLAPIRNAVRILRRPGVPEALQASAGEMIDRQTQHMVRLVDDLLEVSRITLGKLELRREIVSLGTVVEQAVDAVWPQVEKGGFELAVALPPERLHLHADPVRLVQVLANLLNNACKYTDPGGHIRLSVEHRDGQAVVRVSDDGIGVPPERLPLLFRMFSQDERALGRSEGGLGIGLALCKGLVELHGGTIAARSEGAGRGSEFTVTLPLAAPPRASAAEIATVDGGASGAARRVLVVDDNRDAADSLAALLRLDGCDVRVAYGGAEALEVARRMRAEFVLLDLGMPGMDGYAVCRALRAQAGDAPMTIAALTGWGQAQDRERSAQAGFDAHLVKPVDLDQLAALLKGSGD